MFSQAYVPTADLVHNLLSDSRTAEQIVVDPNAPIPNPSLATHATEELTPILTAQEGVHPRANGYKPYNIRPVNSSGNGVVGPVSLVSD